MLYPGLIRKGERGGAVGNEIGAVRCGERCCSGE